MKITIITINYNNLKGLKTTFESVKNQTYQAFEYIVIDGGSTDGSLTFLEKHSSDINYWISEPDNGVYNAMNKGIQKATGEYVLFLNSGDHFYNSKVLEQNHDQVNTYDIIYFNQYVIGKTKKFLKEYPEKLSFAYFLKDNLPHQASFIKKALFDKVGIFDENFKIISDWKFFIDSVCRFNVSYKYVNKTLTTFYQDGISSLAENIKVINEEKQKILQSSYLPYMQDLENLLEYMTVINNLRKSRKIKWLIKLGLINKF